MYEADQTTLEMANFPIEGNVIDHSWPFIILKENGKPDHLAISLLAHVVYWYRPCFDPISKKLGKKYKSDLLQRSYAEIEDMLGLTKREAQEAFQRLEKLDLVHRVLRTIEINGQKISNILFIKFNHLKLTAMREDFFKKCIPLYAKKDEGVRQKGQGDTPNVMTYTKNTEQTSTETSHLQNNNPQPPSLDIECISNPESVVAVSLDTKKEQSKADAEKQKLFKRMKDLGLSDKTIEKAFHQKISDIENAIECCLNRIESIDDVEAYFMSALKEKWQPKPSKEKLAKLEEIAQTEKQQQQKKLYIEASSLTLAAKNKLKDKYSIHITENCVRFDTPQGSTPMKLTKQSIDVIKRFIQDNSKPST